MMMIIKILVWVCGCMCVYGYFMSGVFYSLGPGKSRMIVVW